MGRSRSRKEKRSDNERYNNSSSNGANSGGNSGPSSGPSWAAWNKQKEKLETAEAKANAVDDAKKKTEEEQTLTTKITAAIHSTMRMAGFIGPELPPAETAPRQGAGLPPFMLGAAAASSAGGAAITPMQLQMMAAQHGLQVVPGNDTPRQNMFMPQHSAAGSILGGLGELSGMSSFRGLRRLDECGGGMLNGGMRGYGGRVGRSRSTSRRSSRTSDKSGKSKRSSKDKKKTERRRPPSTSSSSASDKKNKKDKKSKDDKKDKKDNKEKKTRVHKGRANNDTSEIESTGETGEEWSSRQPTRRNSGAASARGRGGGHEVRAAGARNFGTVLGETSPQTKWSQAARSLKESLNIVDTEAEPLLDSESEESIEVWATWCSGKCNAVQLDHLCRTNGITCRFEGKQKKIVRLLKWGVE